MKEKRSQTAPLNPLPLLHFYPGGVHRELVEWLPDTKLGNFTNPNY